MTDLKGKSVIITGGSRGIGRETARRFLQAGASVTITGRSTEALEKTCKELELIAPRITGIRADVSNENDCRNTVNSVIEKMGRIDILVNNAGMSARGLFAESEIDLYKKLIGINYLGPVMMSRLCLEEIRVNKGSILFISTIAALRGIPGLSHYSSSKMPLTGFSQAIRGELKGEDVHISTIYIGFTENDPDKTIYDAQGNRIPLKRDKNSLSQQKVASAIFNAVKHRKEVVTLSALGKLASFFYKFFPGISDIFLAKQVLKSSQYKELT